MATTERTQKRWRILWGAQSHIGTIYDQDDNEIAVVEIKDDQEGQLVASLMQAAPQMAEALEAVDEAMVKLFRSPKLSMDEGVFHAWLELWRKVGFALAAAREEWM